MRKFRAVKIAEKGDIMDDKGHSIICPVRAAVCNDKCAWYSMEGRVICCQDTVIGAIRGQAIRSFRLSLGPQVYDEDA
jgi:hypothetical protein